MPYIDAAARVKVDPCVKAFPSLEGEEAIGRLIEVISFISVQALIGDGKDYKADFSVLPWCPKNLEDWRGLTRGEYNFLITMACHMYALAFREPKQEYPKYHTFNDAIGGTEFVIGCLQETTKELDVNDVVRTLGIVRCSQLEMYRVCAGRYENKKMRDNGPVSDLDRPWAEDMWEAGSEYPNG